MSANNTDSWKNPSTEAMFEYQSVWERFQNLPPGAVLYRRNEFPEFLSTEEISSLFTEDPSERTDLKKLLDGSIQRNDLHSGYRSIEAVPANPYEVIQSMAQHIRLIEEKLQQLEKDVRHTLAKNHRETDQDIYKTRKDILSVIRKLSNDSNNCTTSTLNDNEIRSKIDGKLLRAKTQMPIRGGHGIGYETKKTSKCVNLVNAIEMEKWLKTNGEWPLPNHVPLSRWFVKKKKKNGRLLRNTVRQEILKLVAEDFKRQGVNPLHYPGRAQDVFELCRKKAIAEYPNYRGAFTQFSTWRSKFFNFERSRYSLGIIELEGRKTLGKK